jgi:hypothetical protein
MSITVTKQALAGSVWCDEDHLHVALIDGRELTVPLAWFPRLLHATPVQRSSWRLLGRGAGIHWPELDEDISVHDLL